MDSKKMTVGAWTRDRAGAATARLGDTRLLSRHAGVLRHAWPLASAYATGALRALVRKGPPSWDPAHPPRVERETLPTRIGRRRVAEYLALTDGEDLDPRRTRLVPPVYYTTWSLAPFLQVLTDPSLGLGLLGLVHLENTLEVHRPIRPDERPHCRVSLADAAATHRGWEITVSVENRVGETLASESRSRLLVHRAPPAGRQRAARPGGEAAEGSAPGAKDAPWSTIRVIDLPAHLGRRYAWLVGDANPIHLSRLTARPFGFGAAILHGFCLKAMVAHAVIRAEGQRDPARLERLHIRFRKPVYLPGRIEIQTQQGTRFRVRDPESNRLHAAGTYRIG